MSNESRFIVITSIFPPTRAVRDYARMRGWRVVVVADRKTPVPWIAANCDLLSVEKQAVASGQLAQLLPWNHYTRKNLGYLHAIACGATEIVDTDDDNIPMENWGFPLSAGTHLTTAENLQHINVYRYFTDQAIWPRGLPLSEIRKPAAYLESLTQATSEVKIWQGLADGDPDVDAIYRLTSDRPCTFERKPPIVLGHGTVCAFNSQNTLFHSPVFALLYLPARVTFRFTDILRGLVAQPILWACGYRLGFTQATVVQERNPHDYFEDFRSEVPMYLSGENVHRIVSGAIREGDSVSLNLARAYHALAERSIVPAEELKLVEAWCCDIESSFAQAAGAP